MSYIINKAKEESKKMKDAQDQENRIAAEKQKNLDAKLNSLVKAILPKIRELDGENTKYGKLYISESHTYNNEKLGVYCSNESRDKCGMSTIILRAEMYIYEDNWYDCCSSTYIVPRVYAMVFDPVYQYKIETISTNINKTMNNIHESYIVEEFINDLGLALSNMGWV